MEQITQLQTIPAASLIGMVFTLVIVVGLPVVLCIFLYRKKGAKLSSLLSGCICFFVFAIILEQMLHSVVLNAAGTALTDNIWLYALYGGLAAAVFEETGRYIVMKRFMKKDMIRENALMFGVGHGGIEAIMIVGMTYFNYLMTSVMINTGQMQASLSGMEEEARTAALQGLSGLWLLPSWQFYVAGIERVQAIALHIALSVFVYKAVKSRRMQYLLMALGMHFIVDFLAVAATKFLPLWAIEFMVLALVAVIAFVAFRVYKGEDNQAKPSEI